MKIRKHRTGIKKNTSILYGGILLLLVTIIPLYFVLSPKDTNEIVHAIDTTQQTHNIIQEKTPLEHCFSLQENRDECYFNLCEKENPYLCAEDLLEQIVQISGPEQATDALYDIKGSNHFVIKNEVHQLSHIIGRSTAQQYGFNEESLLRCPSDFRYGCVHGFFEHGLVEEADPVKVATKICLKHFFCYHGIGHGFVFHTSYNLMDALSLCDQIPSLKMRENCYSGVFMENVSGFFDKVEGEMGFLEDDIFAPCNKIEDKYYTDCWQEHARYIARQYKWSIRDVTQLCLSAEDHIHACISAFGNYVTSDGPQESFKGSFNGTHAETTAYLCNQFPPEYIETCQNVSIHRFLNDNQFDNKMASEFCLSLQDGIGHCFKKIGFNLLEVVKDTDRIIVGCNRVPTEYRESCYQGAGITDVHQDTGMLPS